MTYITREHVAISAFGAVTPLGETLDDITTAFYEGRSGIRTIEKFDTKSFTTKWAGVPEMGNAAIRWPRTSERDSVRPGELIYAERAIRNLVANIDPLSIYIPERLGCVLGVDEPAIDVQRCISLLKKIGLGGYGNREKFIAKAIEHFRLSELLDLDVTSALRIIHQVVPFRGYARCHVGLCSASLQALGMARSAILSGKIDAAIVGGVSAKVTPVNIARLEGVGAVCTDVTLEGSSRSRPFDTRRSGFVPAEGSVLFLLEREEAIRSRGHEPLARLTGYGSSLAAEHIIAPHSCELEMKLCMSRALADAKIPVEAISHVNSHGTSTKLNDLHESRAIAQLFKNSRPTVTATKSLHGHLIATAGAMEVVGIISSFKHDFLPGIANLDEVDPEVSVQLVRNIKLGHVNRVLKNSFGMGGLAASVILENPNQID